MLTVQLYISGDLMGISLHDFCLFIADGTERINCPPPGEISTDKWATKPKNENQTFLVLR